MRRGRIAESAEVDDPLDAGGLCGLGEVAGTAPVALLEVGVAAAAHRVDEVIGDVDAGEGVVEARAVEDVAADDLAARVELGRRRIGIASQAADFTPVLSEALGQQAADVAGGPGDQVHGSPATRRGRR